MIRPGSFFLDEGDFLLLQEFGKKYGNYYSILASIASGRDTMADILALFTGGSIGGKSNSGSNFPNRCFTGISAP